MRSENPNHRENWSTSELTAIVGSTGLAGIETAALVTGNGTMRSFGLIIMAAIAVMMTLAGRRWRHTAANWRYINSEGER